MRGDVAHISRISLLCLNRLSPVIGFLLRFSDGKDFAPVFSAMKFDGQNFFFLRLSNSQRGLQDAEKCQI